MSDLSASPIHTSPIHTSHLAEVVSHTYNDELTQTLVTIAQSNAKAKLHAYAHALKHAAIEERATLHTLRKTNNQHRDYLAELHNLSEFAPYKSSPIDLTDEPLFAPKKVKRTRRNFCPDCAEALVNGEGLKIRLTRGIYTTINHGGCCVSVFDLHGKLLKPQSREEFEVDQAKKGKRDCLKTTPIAIKTPLVSKTTMHSVENRYVLMLQESILQMGEKMREMPKMADVELHEMVVNGSRGNNAVRYLKTCIRWLTEMRMEFKSGHEARSFNSILLESRIFPN